MEPWIEQCVNDIECKAITDDIAEIITKHHAACALSARLAAERVQKLEGWLAAIGELADVDADERGWMVRHAIAGKEPPTTAPRQS